MTVVSPTAASPLRGSAGRAVGLALVAVGLAALHLPWRPPTLCLLRATTGIPCPLCGSTTAAVSVGRGEALAAFAASPLATLGAVALVLQPALRPRLPQLSSRRVLWGLIAVVAVASELWQLHRFALL